MKTILLSQAKRGFLIHEEIPHSGDRLLKNSCFWLWIIEWEPQISSCTFHPVRVFRGGFSQGLGAGLAKGGMCWGRDRALLRPRLFPGGDNWDGKVAYTASSSLSAHSVVLEPSRSTTVSRHSRLLPSGGCTSGKGREGKGWAGIQPRPRRCLRDPPRAPNSPWLRSWWV